MKDLMETNVYDVCKSMIIVGTCLKDMQPLAYEKLKTISPNIYKVCLEHDHVNMVITKLASILCRVKIDNLIFASVDGSLHCIQLHYIMEEIKKMMSTENINITHYVAVDNNLIKISSDTIKKSKLLSLLQKTKI